MSARQKLNQGYVISCVVVAGIVGLCCQSSVAFCVAAGVLIANSVDSGAIRPTSRPTKRDHQQTRHLPRRPMRRRRRK